MARVVTGVDVGARTAVALRGRAKGNTFAVTDYAFEEHAGGVAGGWAALATSFKLGRCRVGVSGREVNVRYTRVPRVPDWQLRKLMRFEVEEVGGQSEAVVASDFNVLPEIPEIEGEDVVLLAMARERLLEEHRAGLEEAGGKLDAFTPGAIALYNAWLRFGVLMEDTVLVANIGHENVDVVLARGTDLLFARNLSGGSGLFDEALASAFGAGAQKAEQLKRQRGTLVAGGDNTSEKVRQALLAPAGQLLSLLQSTVAFCKSQVKLSGLKLDRVMICGGGAALPGLDRHLSQALRVPVEVFDPFALVDTSALAPEAVAELERHGVQSVCALGLATAASDPEAYAIEILPAALARRRELWGGKAFLVAAALIAAGAVGFEAWRSSEELAEVQGRARTLKSQLDRARRAHNATEELLSANADLAVLGGELFALAGSGEQVARTLEALDAHLPSELWVTSFASDWGSDPELGVERSAELPIVHVEGRAREGTESVATLFREFEERLRAALPGARLKASLGPAQTTFTLDVCQLVADPDEAPAEGAGEEDA